MRVSPGLLISCSLLLGSSPLVPLGAHVRITTKVTWDREIAPIVQARCVSCHSAGGKAPMALTTYEEARPWAKAIKEEVLARRMPKWGNARGWGDFSNDPSLSAFEIALIAAWADGGAPASAKASTFAEAPGPASALPATGQTRRTRAVEVSCGSRSLPVGRLLGVKPVLGKGDALRLTLVHGDGRIEPLLWLRSFDPGFAETYWLRNPLAITARTRMTAEAPAGCTVTALLEARTGK